MMSAYPFSQLMLTNIFQFQGASAKVCLITPSASNAGSGYMRRTEGGATLLDFFVTPRKQGIIPRFSRRFANSIKVATRQLRKEGGLTSLL